MGEQVELLEDHAAAHPQVTDLFPFGPDPVATLDAEGYGNIVGRIKDMVIRGGENVYPREIEHLLLEHPNIAGVAIIGVPDTYWGEQVGAVVMAKDKAHPPSAAELHDFCRAQLASYKTPKLWYFVDEFPWTETGKLQKFKLIEAIKAGTMKPAAL